MAAEPQPTASCSFPDQLLCGDDHEEQGIPVPGGGVVTCGRLVTSDGSVCAGIVVGSAGRSQRNFAVHVCSDLVFALAMNPSAFGSDIVCLGPAALFHGKRGIAAIAGVLLRYARLGLVREFGFLHSRLIGTAMKPGASVRALVLRHGTWHGLRVKHVDPKLPGWMPGPALQEVLKCFVENRGSVVPLAELDTEKSVALLADEN